MWWSCFGCNSNVGCYRRCRGNENIGTKAGEFFLGDFEDCRWNLSRCRLETGRQLLGKFNVDKVDTLNTVPVLFEVDKNYNTFIFHELDNVGCFGKFRVDMGFHKGMECIHLFGLGHSHDCKNFSETTGNRDVFFFGSDWI